MPQVKFHDVIQNSEEWYSLRGGKVTSSSLSKIMANYGKSFGEPAKQYALDIAVEQITGKPVSNGFSNEHTERGHAQEPMARLRYESEMFCEVSNGGFFECGNVGASPDGLVGNDGVIEIKSAIPGVHAKRIKSNTYDSAYKWQLIGNMKLTGRRWIDFISYCPDFDEEQQIFIRRLYADDFQHEFLQIDNRLVEFSSLIKKTKQEIITTQMIFIERA